ncbi:unnamed protein product [Boreogadus saida]
MEEKGIALWELSCRTCRRAPRAGAAGLPPRPSPAGPASFGGSSAPGVHLPEQPESFGCSSAPGVHCRSCRTAAEASAAAGWLRRQSGGGSSAAVRQLSSGSTITFSSMSPLSYALIGGEWGSGRSGNTERGTESTLSLCRLGPNLWQASHRCSLSIKSRPRGTTHLARREPRLWPSKGKAKVD